MATKYTNLVVAKKKHCEGKITKASLNKAVSAYKKDGEKKGKKKDYLNRVANNILKGTCGSRMNGTKSTKRKTTKKKTTTRRRTR